MRSVIAAGLLSVLAAAPARADCSATDRAGLEALDREWSEANRRGDRAHLESLLGDDYAALSLWGTTDKAIAIANAMAQAERDRVSATASRATTDYYVITCSPTTATITHRNVVTSGQGADERTSYSRSIHFLEKRSGRWNVVASTNAPVNDAGVLAYLEADWNEAWKNRDVAWFERNLAEDATLIATGTGALQRKGEHIAELRSDKTTVESMELSELNTRLHGDVAIVTGLNRVRGRDAQGRAFDRRVRFTDTFVKRGERWVVLTSQGTYVQ